MQLHIADFAVPVAAFNEKKGLLQVSVPEKHRAFFKSWTEKVFKAKPWERGPRAVAAVAKYGYLIADGLAFTTSQKREVRVYPKFSHPATGAITFEVLSR